MTEYKASGYCNAHKGNGTKLNIAHPGGRVADFYKLTKPSYVCDSCWKAVDETKGTTFLD